MKTANIYQFICHGKTDTIQIKFYEPEILLKSITINEKIPITISLWRILILFGTITFIYCLRNFEIFKIPFSNKNLKQEIILVGILGIFLCLIYFINNYSANREYDFYCYNFVKAISNGSFSLEEKPNQKLLEMENPYDTIGRENKGIRRNTDYFWDTALYNGNAYIYFGILPVLVLFLPYHLITRQFHVFSHSVYLFSQF